MTDWLISCQQFDGVDGGDDDDLIILVDTAQGSFDFYGAIGSTQALTTLNINATDGDISFTVPQVGDGAGGDAGVSGATAFGFSGRGGDIIFSNGGANAYKFGGSLTVTSNGGAGAFQFTGSDPTVTAGGAVAFNEGAGTDDTMVLADLRI